MRLVGKRALVTGAAYLVDLRSVRSAELRFVFAKAFFQMRLPLGVQLALGSRLQFRRSVQNLPKMFFAQPSIHWPGRKKSSSFAVATADVLASSAHVYFH